MVDGRDSLAIAGMVLGVHLAIVGLMARVLLDETPQVSVYSFRTAKESHEPASIRKNVIVLALVPLGRTYLAIIRPEVSFGPMHIYYLKEAKAAFCTRMDLAKGMMLSRVDRIELL